MSARTPSKPKIVILDEPSLDSAALLNLMSRDPDPETHAAFPGMQKFSNVTLKRGVVDAADGGGSEAPIPTTPEWTDVDASDPGITPSMDMDGADSGDWLM